MFKKGGTFREHVYKYMTIPKAQDAQKKTRDVNHGLRQLELGDSDTCLITTERVRQSESKQSSHPSHP